jgi:oligopeptide transport system substrate-binding protein
MVHLSSFFSYLLACSLSLAFLGGCQKSSSPKRIKNDLALCITSDPQHLNVAKASDSVSAFILRMIYEGLTRLDHEGNPQPALAQRWEISEGGTCYRFYLRKAHWSNGDPIRAQDFVKAWQYLLDPKTGSANAYLLFPIQHSRLIKFEQLSPFALGARALDDQTLEVRLEQPTPYFLQLLAFDAFYPSLIPTLGDKALEGPICCGPFELVSWKAKNEIRLKANPKYWDKENVQLSQIRILILADSQTALHMYEKGELDWVGSPLIPLPTEASEVLAEEGLLHVYHGASTYWVHCNFSHPLLQNLKARQALSLAINRKNLSENLGHQQTPAYRLVPPLVSEQYELGLNLEYDPAKAQKLWQEAMKETGYEKSPTLTYIYNSSSLHAKVAQLLQDQWKNNLGIDIHLEGLEWAIFLQRVRSGRFDLARFGWRAQFSDPTTFLEIFDPKDGAYNFSRFDHEGFHQKLFHARLSPKKERLEALTQAEKVLLEELPVLPLFFESYTYLKNPKLKEVIIGPLGRIDFKLAYWENPDS